MVATDDEKRQIVQSQQGDPSAFEALIREHQRMIHSLCYRMSGSLADAEDLAQETFLEAWKHLGALREPERLRSWLCGIARNRIHQLLRSQGREPTHQAEPLESLATSPSPEPPPPGP